MSDISIDMNEGTATFRINETGKSHGETYKGVFKVKCILNPIEFIEADALYRELLGKHNPTLTSDWVGRIAWALAQCKFRIIKHPPFWVSEESRLPGGHIDDNILIKVSDLAFDAEVKYREAIKAKFDTAIEDLKKAVDNGTISRPEEEKAEAKDQVENDID